MITIMTMADTGGDAALLTLSQWLSPSFPLGSFAYSHGLETAVVSGDVSDAASLQAWLTEVLVSGSGLVDAVLLAAALEDPDCGPDWAAEAQARAASKERWEETMAQGRAFTLTVNALTGQNRPEWPLPVAVGMATSDLGLRAQSVIAFYLQSFAANLVMAAVRFVPLGQTEGQAVIAALQPVVTEVAERALQVSLDQVGTAAFGADMSALQHEALEVRVFKT